MKGILCTPSVGKQIEENRKRPPHLGKFMWPIKSRVQQLSIDQNCNWRQINVAAGNRFNSDPATDFIFGFIQPEQMASVNPRLCLLCMRGVSLQRPTTYIALTSLAHAVTQGSICALTNYERHVMDGGLEGGISRVKSWCKNEQQGCSGREEESDLVILLSSPSSFITSLSSLHHKAHLSFVHCQTISVLFVTIIVMQCSF